MAEVVDIKYFGDVETSSQIDPATNASEDVRIYVKQSLERYTIIDVTKAMEQLSNVSGLLKLSNAASKGFDCNAPIIKILGKYQTMINNTAVTTGDFIEKCIECLGLYKAALDCCDELEFDTAFETLGQTAENAKAMAKKSDELVKQAQELVDLALEALEMASKNETEETKKLKENLKMMDKLNADAESLKSQVKDLDEQIAEMKELGDNAAADAKEERRMQNIMRIVGAIAEPLASMAGSAIAAYTGVPPVGKVKSLINQGQTGKTEDEQNEPDEKDSPSQKVIKKQNKLKKEEEEKKEELEKKEEEVKELETKEKNGTKLTEEETEKKTKLKGEIENIKKAISQLGTNIANVANEMAKEYKEAVAESKNRELEYRKLKAQYQDLKRAANADLAKNLSTLKSLDLEKSNLKIGIQSLNIVINAMGKVKTIFENTRVFWESVEAHCNQLANLGKIAISKKLIKTNKPANIIKFKNEIKKSGCGWLALAKINLEAFNAIKQVKKETDNTMMNLPNTEQAKAIVKETTDELEKKVKEENDEIEEVKKKIKEENNKEPSKPSV